MAECYTKIKYIPNIKIHIAAFAMVPMYVYLINLFSSSKLLMPIPNPMAEAINETNSINPT